MILMVTATLQVCCKEVPEYLWFDWDNEWTKWINPEIFLFFISLLSCLPQYMCNYIIWNPSWNITRGEPMFYWPHKETQTYARTAHNGLQQKRLQEDPCWVISHVPTHNRSCDYTESGTNFFVYYNLHVNQPLSKDHPHCKIFYLVLTVAFYQGLHCISIHCLE